MSRIAIDVRPADSRLANDDVMKPVSASERRSAPIRVEFVLAGEAGVANETQRTQKALCKPEGLSCDVRCRWGSRITCS